MTGKCPEIFRNYEFFGRHIYVHGRQWLIYSIYKGISYSTWHVTNDWWILVIILIIAGSLTVLQNCSTNIEALCPTANQTLLDEVAACKTAADNFRHVLYYVVTKRLSNVL